MTHEAIMTVNYFPHSLSNNSSAIRISDRSARTRAGEYRNTCNGVTYLQYKI